MKVIKSLNMLSRYDAEYIPEYLSAKCREEHLKLYWTWSSSSDTMIKASPIERTKTFHWKNRTPSIVWKYFGSNISNTRTSVWSCFQTSRTEVKTRGAAEFYNESSRSGASVWCNFSNKYVLQEKTKEKVWSHFQINADRSVVWAWYRCENM